MASVDSQMRRPLRLEGDRNWSYLLPFLFAIPEVYLAWASYHALFLSDTNARLIAKTLILLDHGALKSIGFFFPPLPLLLTAISPTPLGVSLLSSLAGGVALWIIWRYLVRTKTPVIFRITLIFAFMTIIPIAFLFTQSLTDAIELMFFTFAWRAFLQFFLKDITWSGFVAGMLLAVAFSFNITALLWGILFGVGAFGLAKFSRRVSRRKDPGSGYVMAMIIVFPVVYIFFSWCYISWINYGDPFRFLHNAVIPIFGYLYPSGQIVSTFKDALYLTLEVFLRQPLNLALYGILLLTSTLWVAVPGVAITGIAFLHSFNLVVYSEGLATGTFLVMALMALAPRMPVQREAFLLFAALFQALVSPFLPVHTPEINQWREVIFSGAPRNEDILEQLTADRLAQVSSGRILTDNRSAFRLIARAGSAKPFLLPTDATYAEAVIYPKGFVDYVLVSETPSPVDYLSRLYARDPPKSFVMSSHWPGWILYRRTNAPAILPEDIFEKP